MISCGSVEDRLAIRELVESYDHAVMSRDEEAWAENWAEDGVWSVHGEVVRGREQIVALWKQHMSNFSFIDFFARPGPILVKGDRASGTWYQQERLYATSGGKRGATGLYEDEYVKRNDRWYFQKRVFRVLDVRDSN